jgi:hypothetical protein
VARFSLDGIPRSGIARPQGISTGQWTMSPVSSPIARGLMNARDGQT